jgi:hypothetical protein
MTHKNRRSSGHPDDIVEIITDDNQPLLLRF